METQSPSPTRGRSPQIFSAHVYCGQTAGWIKMPLCTKVGLSPGDSVLDGDPAPTPKGAEPHIIFGPRLLWSNGCIDQDATWYGGRLQPRRLCVRWDPAPTPKGAEPHLIFGPRLLWPNGCMDQDATWYGCRPRPTRDCVRCGSIATPKKGTPTCAQFLANVYCGQMAGWMKTPLGTKV